ncbi:MAG: DinB family protein, partial [bacterium]
MTASSDAIWRQFGASIDMLEGAIRACPDDLWDDRSQQPVVWRLAFHTLFWLDLYLSGAVEGFSPPAPFGLDELEWGGAPPRVYSKEELLGYLEHCRRKCRATMASLTEAKAREIREFRWGRVSFEELLVYNLRHVQHGAAQLNLVLRREAGTAAPWVCR